jgi:hypothetical protein
MIQYQNLVKKLRQQLKAWFEKNEPKIESMAGIGVTALAIGALFAQLSLEAQATSWAVVVATLSAELGKEFVVGLVEQIRDRNLSTEDVSRIMQHELDRKQNLTDLQRLIEEVDLLPTALEVILRQGNIQLLIALQSDLSAYPQIISNQTAQHIQSVLIPEFARLNNRLDNLDATGQKILQILHSFAATSSITRTTGSEAPFVVFISCIMEELSQERQILRTTLTALGITKPWMFELTPATNRDLDQKHLDNIRHCDFFILLIDENISPEVEREFDAAITFDRPIFAFLKKDKPDKDMLRSSQAKSLIQRIPTQCVAFTSLSDLALQARMAICDEIIRRVRDKALHLSSDGLESLEKTGIRLRKAVSNLPGRRYTRLLGRSDDLAILRSKLFNFDSTELPIVAITGLGGIGKTALAFEIAEEAILEGWFGGLVWESAKSEELQDSKIIPLESQTLTPQSILHSIAVQIGDEKLAYLSPKDFEKRIRSLLQSSPYLIIVDNLETVDSYSQLAQFLHSLLSPSYSNQASRAVLTSRERLFGIPYIYDHYVRGLSRSDSYDFIRLEANDRGAADLATMTDSLKERIFLITQGMPLAMKLVVSQFIAGIPLDTELDRLQNAKEYELYEYIYLSLWSKLSIPAKKVLVSAASFSSFVSRSMLQPVSRVTDDDLENAVTELVRLSLIEASNDLVAADRRYSIHPLTRWFVNSPLRNRWQRTQRL